MDSVEVDATVKESAASYRETGQMNLEVLDLRKLDPDVNGDGKISASEKRIYEFLQAADKDGDGKLSLSEMYGALGKLTRIDTTRKIYKAVAIFVGVALAATIIVLVLLQVLVEEVITKEQFVKHSVCPSWGNMGDGFTNFQGDIIAMTPAKRNLPLYVAPVLPVGERESLQTMTISYRDPSVHEFMVEKGVIGENDTSVEYPTVEETVTVLSFTRYNATAADLGVVAKKVGEHRIIRIFNGEATLVTTRPDGSSYFSVLCAGKVSCAAFTVETGIADAFIEEANGNLTAIGVEVPTGRRLEENTASVHRRLSESGDCPCADGWVKFGGQWVQPTDAEAEEAGYVRSADASNACGCVTWVKKEDERRGLFDDAACEDAPDELVAKMTEDAIGVRVESCAALKDISACEHEAAKMHCPASCGLCDQLSLQHLLVRRRLSKCT